MHQLGLDRGRRSPVSRAVQWLEQVQGADGAAPSLWFRDSTHGTAKVLEACAEVGLLNSSMAAKARTWLLSHQRSDGAWPSEAVEGPPDGGTVEETAWAVYSLLRAGESPWQATIVRAVEWLAAR